MAGLFCFNGDSDKCLKELGQAVDHGYYNYTIIEGDPFFDEVRGTPEYKAIYERAKRKSGEFAAKHLH